MTYYWDMDGVLANFHKAYAADKATALKREAMANLEPFFANVNTLRDLIAAGRMARQVRAGDGRRPHHHPHQGPQGGRHP